ncbi:MAG: outer membrane lipoprotein chaperone LolA [Xanthomonadales bacterium]|nr:outer membrane lipoprotein chaperone LolA [Xanthomonadales bacterium]
MNLTILALALVATVLVVPAAANPGEARASLEAFANGLDDLHARFTQVVIDPEGSIESEGRGEVWMQTPNRFRWRYDGDFPELIVADGERVWQYDEMLEQVTVRTQSAEAADSPLLLLSDLAALEQQFTITELGEWQEALMLSLEPVSEEREFERVLLGFREGEIALMGLEDAFGIRTELRFESVSRNPGLEDGLFAFELPPGADVIGEVTPQARP